MWTILALTSTMMLAASGCTQRVVAREDHTLDAELLRQVRTILVLPLDFAKIPWVQGYGEEKQYDSYRQSWGRIFQQTLLERLGLKRDVVLIGPQDKQDEGIVIKAVAQKIVPGFDPSLGGYDTVMVSITIVDGGTGDNAYEGLIEARSLGTGPQGWTFDGRIGFAAANAAAFVAKRLLSKP